MLEDESATRIVLLRRDQETSSSKYRSAAYFQRRYFGLIHTNRLVREEFMPLYLKTFKAAVPFQDLPTYLSVYPLKAAAKTLEIVNIVHALMSTSPIVPSVDVMPLLLQNWTGQPAIEKLDLELSKLPTPYETFQRLVYVSDYLRKGCVSGAISTIILGRTVSSQGTVMTIELSAEVNTSSDTELRESILYAFLENASLDWRKGSVHIVCRSGNFIFDNHHSAWVVRIGTGRGSRFRHRRRPLFHEVDA
jgi:hypothetical protein